MQRMHPQRNMQIHSTRKKIEGVWFYMYKLDEGKEDTKGEEIEYPFRHGRIVFDGRHGMVTIPEAGRLLLEMVK